VKVPERCRWPWEGGSNSGCELRRMCDSGLDLEVGRAMGGIPGKTPKKVRVAHLYLIR
jgi:hypothetical protein